MEPEQEYVKRMLEQYMISDTYGFLHGVELPELPQQYNEWLRIANYLPQLLHDKKLRDLVDLMPRVNTGDITDYLMLRHLHTVIALITNCYVWQNGEKAAPKYIPEQLAVPLAHVSARLDLPPIICHADVVLTNYMAIDSSKPLSLGNIKLRYRISGDETCDWFFLATVGVELECVPAIKTILQCQYCVEHEMVERAAQLLNILSQQITSIQVAMSRMHEQLDGKKFYEIVRPFLNGWHEKGMIYAGVSDQPIKAYGGSAAQCTGIQAIDIFLGIQHEPEKRKFLLTMRDYMPAAHRNLLYKLESICHTKQFVKRQGLDTAIGEAYDKCVQSMVHTRSKHLQLVVKYVTIQAAQNRDKTYGSLQTKGTGGQELLQFLKNIRSTTQTSLLDGDHQ